MFVSLREYFGQLLGQLFECLRYFIATFGAALHMQYFLVLAEPLGFFFVDLPVFLCVGFVAYDDDVHVRQCEFFDLIESNGTSPSQ